MPRLALSPVPSLSNGAAISLGVLIVHQLVDVFQRLTFLIHLLLQWDFRKDIRYP